MSADSDQKEPGTPLLRRSIRRATGGMPMATITDVALLAEVSIKTVSRVVNREPNVRPELVQRVQQAIAELNYRPNFSARNLAGRKAYLIALIYDNPNDSYVIGIQHGALNACQQLGYSVLLQPCTVTSPTLIDDLLTMTRERRPTGLLLTPPLSDVTALLDALDANEVDYACVGATDRIRQAPVVCADDQQSAYDLCAYLLKLGHQRIAFISAPAAHVAAQARTAGFLQAHREHDLAVDAELIATGDFTYESGVACARTWLSLPHPPTAIFAANDDMAIGVLQVAHELGLNVPAELSVAGFDDTPMARCVWPSLTTVRQPIRAMAETAVKTLVATLAERARGSAGPGAKTVLHNELIVRASTGPAQR